MVSQMEEVVVGSLNFQKDKFFLLLLFVSTTLVVSISMYRSLLRLFPLS